MEDLQTDVMRFMAILAFCLVAVFALVQSIPVGPEQSALAQETQARSLAPTPSVKPLERPLSVPAQTLPAQRPAPRIAAPTVARPAFTLRFASDAALHRLVQSGQVQLYALAKGSVWRLSPGAGGLVFELGSTTPTHCPAQLLAVSRCG